MNRLEIHEGQLQRYEGVADQMRFTCDAPRALEDVRDMLMAAGLMPSYRWNASAPLIAETVAEVIGSIEAMRARLAFFEREGDV